MSAGSSFFERNFFFGFFFPHKQKKMARLCLPPEEENVSKHPDFVQAVQKLTTCLSHENKLASICRKQTDVLNSHWKLPRFYLPFTTSELDASKLPCVPYRRRVLEIRPVVHIGQLKLLISELWFLSQFGHYSTEVVYVGAACGTHLLFLSKLFSKHHFHLYDPREFNKKLYDVKNVHIYQQLFTLDSITKYQGQKVLFISDLRTGDAIEHPEDFENCIRRDMQLQRDIVEQMKPSFAMLKMRFPYSSDGFTEYLAPYRFDCLRYGVFTSKSSTELRIICSGENIKLIRYSHQLLEQHCHYFNSIFRCMQYHFEGLPKMREWNSVVGSKHGLDQCWDCVAFVNTCLIFMSSEHCDFVACATTTQEEEQQQTNMKKKNFYEPIIFEYLYTKLTNIFKEQFTCSIYQLITLYCGCITLNVLNCFVDFIMKQCSAKALSKLKNYPHGDQSLIHWCVRAPVYSNFKRVIYFRKKRKIDAEAVKEGSSLYQSVVLPANKKPPLWDTTILHE